MLHIDINPTLNLIVKILYRLGIWRDWEVGSAARKWTIRGAYMFAYLLLLIFLVACALVSKEKNEFTFLCLIVVIVGVIGIKLVFLLLREDEMLTFLHSTTEHRKDMSSKQVERVNFLLSFINGYIGMLILALIFYNTSCLPWFTRDKKLPFFIRFRWTGAHSDIVYWICYVFVGTGIVYCNVSNLNTSIIWFLMLNFVIDYEILGSKLSVLGDRSKKSSSGPLIKNGNFLQKLIDLVTDHRNLFKNIEQFRSCFLMLFFIQMITSGITVCISTYNLAFNSQNNFFETAIYIAVLLYAFFDIFMIMYFGNEIKIASDRLSYCLFQSDWTQQSTVVKKSLIFIGEILKQPHQLVIFIYPLDLKTLTMTTLTTTSFVTGLIIKGAYTMFNVLQNLD